MFMKHPQLYQKRIELLNIVNELRKNGVTDEQLIIELNKLDFDYMHLFRSYKEMCKFLNIDIIKYNGVKWMT